MNDYFKEIERLFRELRNYTPVYDNMADYTTNAKSYYDYLARSNAFLKLLSDRIWEYEKKFSGYDKQIKDAIESMKKTIYDEIEKIREGGYLEQLYLDSLKNWIDTNLEKIVARISKLVWFGLNDDGYFIAVIPESWSEIDFDTTNDGHLILQY